MSVSSPAPSPRDADLVALALRGDGDAFDQLVRRHYRAAFSVALGVLATRSRRTLLRPRRAGTGPADPPPVLEAALRGGQPPGRSSKAKRSGAVGRPGPGRPSA